VTSLGPGPQPIPEWLFADDVEEVDLGPLKTGKEAEIFLVERRRGDVSCLLVHKRYRPRTAGKGEIEALGFQRSSTFVADHAYRLGRSRTRRSRDQRAIARRSTFGRQLLSEAWAGHELAMLERLWHAGADVPFPVEATTDGMLMEYIGDERGAALTLANARLGPTDLRLAFDQVVDNLRIMLDEGIVHADLSSYNILWWQGRVRIIDLPQAVEIGPHPEAFALLHRDVANVCTFFGRRHVDCDADELFGDLLDGAR
jgi:RIO kinase 1